MNYLVVRDDFGGYQDQTPSFNYWALADEVTTDGARAFFKGHLGVDQDLGVLQPAKHKLHTDSFTHNQCEPIVSQRHRKKYGRAFTETIKLCRVEGQRDQGFLVVVFPYRAGEERPTIERWAGGAGAKISWKGETHYVVLDVTPHQINSEGLKGEASVLVAKVKDGTKSLSLPLSEAVSFGDVKADGLRDFLKR